MAQHTPGPWRAIRGDSVVSIVAADGSDIAATNTKAYWQRHDDQDKANARLIAAAPDLLLAGRAAVAAWELPMTEESAATFETAIQLLRAAIARATDPKVA